MPPHLVALPSLPRGDAAPLAFCSYCGAAPDGPADSRVCPRCTMGLVLEAHPEVTPAPGDAFVVCDFQLRVCALSRGAERLLGTTEPLAVHRPVGDLVRGASRDDLGLPALSALLRGAAAGEIDVRRTIVSVSSPHGLVCPARVGSCGPPPAAVLIIDAPLP